MIGHVIGGLRERIRRDARPIVAAMVLAATLPGVAASAPAAVDTADRLIGGTSVCPSPAAVRAEVETLVPRERLDARLRALGGATAPVEIVDAGVPFKVIAAGRVRAYRDETRDCAYRARVAAVFVALVIDPAAILSAHPGTTADVVKAAPPTPSPPPAPTLAAAPSAAVDTEPRRNGAHLDLGAGVEAGLGSDVRVDQAGLALHLALGSGRIAVVVGAAAMTPVDTSVGGVRLRQWRLPTDASLRVQGRLRIGGRSWLEPHGDLGVAAALLSDRALDLATPQTHTSFELGLRAAVGLRLATRSRVTPFAALHAEVVPSPPTIFALPRGALGNTSRFWIGATLGASWGFL